MKRFSSRAILPYGIFVIGDRAYAGPALRTRLVCVIERTDDELNNCTRAHKLWKTNYSSLDNPIHIVLHNYKKKI